MRLRRRAARSSVDDALEPFDQSSLDVLEHPLDALQRFALLALERVANSRSRTRNRSFSSCQRLAPLDRVRLEVGARVLDRLLGRAVDLFPSFTNAPRCNFALRLQPFGVGREPFLGLLDQSSLAAGERLKLVEQIRLGALEILAPRSESLLDPALRLGERIVQLARRRPARARRSPCAATRRCGAPRRRSARGTRRARAPGRGRARPSARRRLARDRARRFSRAVRSRPRSLRVRDAAPDADRRDGSEQRRVSPAAATASAAPGIESEEHPARKRACADCGRDDEDGALREAVESCAYERNRGEHDGNRERDLKDVDLVHAFIVGLRRAVRAEPRPARRSRR